MKKIKLITVSNYTHPEETITFKSIKRLQEIYTADQLTYEVVTNNKLGISNCYNWCLNNIPNKDYIVAFVHHDADILDMFLVEHLNEAMEVYDIVGVAGTRGPLDLSKPSAWHLMAPRDSFSGMVYHSKDGNTWPTYFGPCPQRCILIDGVFMAVNVERALEVGFKFDEDFDFHHYDISSCLIANEKKLKIGTWNIPLVHHGLGDSMHSKAWEDSATKFNTKYCK